jgi:transposase
VRLALTAGEAHDNRLAGKLLSRLKSGTMVLADRGYDADWIRALAAKRYAWANIPPRSNRNELICFVLWVSSTAAIQRAAGGNTRRDDAFSSAAMRCAFPTLSASRPGRIKRLPVH